MPVLDEAVWTVPVFVIPVAVADRQPVPTAVVFDTAQVGIIVPFRMCGQRRLVAAIADGPVWAYEPEVGRLMVAEVSMVGRDAVIMLEDLEAMVTSAVLVCDASDTHSAAPWTCSSMERLSDPPVIFT